MQQYQPSREILDSYADILVNWALNSGAGIKPGDVVRVQLPECAKPFYVPLRNAIMAAGGHPMMHYIADGVDAADTYHLASEDQLNFFPATYMRGVVDQVDHTIGIIAEADKFELADVDPKKLFQRAKAFRPYGEWRDAKEAAGKFTWTLALYGTPAMAEDVGMTEKEYWEQIIKACFLDQPDPIQAWRNTAGELERIRTALNALEIEKVHVKSADIDLHVQLGKNRSWLGGSGRNVPSFELFISPDWRGTEGKIRFNQPLYIHGTVIRDIELEFRNGVVVEAHAGENESTLLEMIAVENANKIGEFSLTDGRFSHITKLMGETLYDENIGGPEGNTHIAIGKSYQDSYPGDQGVVTSEQWADWGFNSSAVHTDIISTVKRTVTATLPDGSTRVIYKDGQFQV